MIGDSPVNTSNHRSGRAATGAVKDAHGNESGSFGDSVGIASDRSGDMCSVAIAISGVCIAIESGGKVAASCEAISEFAMCGDSGVDDVGSHTSTV